VTQGGFGPVFGEQAPERHAPRRLVATSGSSQQSAAGMCYIPTARPPSSPITGMSCWRLLLSEAAP
jgi:hypothetical protein